MPATDYADFVIHAQRRNARSREYATISSLLRRENVVQPTVRYRDLDDLLERLDAEVVPKAEAKLSEVRPPA
jgi:hypothetical protein